jgi:hypothetical protein
MSIGADPPPSNRRPEVLSPTRISRVLRGLT